MVSKRTVIVRAYFWSGRVFFLLVSAGLLYSASAAWDFLQSREHQPITQLLLQGDRAHVSADHVRAQLQPILGQASFFSVDVDVVRRQLEQLPWLDSVSVRKRWPQGLTIYLSERVATARWENQTTTQQSTADEMLMLLTADNTLFRAEVAAESSEWQLPLLRGPSGSQARVQAMWLELSQVLAQTGQPQHTQEQQANGLTLQDSGSWVIQRADGLKLLLGSERPAERLARYLQVADKLPKGTELKQSDRIADYVDLRYDTGLAIGWRDVEQDKA